VFGYTKERRAERTDIEAYVESMNIALCRLGPGTRDTILALARLPLGVRGSGHVKEEARLSALTEHQVLSKRLGELAHSALGK